MKHRTLVFAAAVLAIAANAAAAQTGRRAATSAADRFEPVREMIRRAIAEDSVPSVAVAVAHNGRIVWEEGFGLSDREKYVPATPHTMYSLASISKPITATALMQLVERGMVDLDRPINDYLGAGKLTGANGDASAATVRRVASHTAGLPLHYQFFYENGGYGRPPMDSTIHRYGVLVSPPGNAYIYSNLGYGILDHVIARVSGQSYADFMKANLFDPLGLTRTSVDIGPGLEAHAAQRYDARRRPIPFYDFDHPGGSAVYSSAHDLVRFGLLHLKNRPAEHRRIVSDASVAEMQRVFTPDTTTGGYGIGWSIARDDFGYRRVSHTGGMPGVNTNLVIYPDDNLVIVVLTNVSHRIPYQAGEAIAGIMLPRYAAARARQQSQPRGPRVVGPAAFPPADLAGSWRGALRTYEDTIPFGLIFQADGDVHVVMGTQPRALLAGATHRNGTLVGRFAGRIPTEEQGRHPHTVLLQLRIQDGRLAGMATAQSSTDPIHYALTSFLSVERLREAPLPAGANAFAGVYAQGDNGVRITVNDTRLGIEGLGVSRTLVHQGDGVFVALDDPLISVSFRDGGSALTITTPSQRTDYVRVGSRGQGRPQGSDRRPGRAIN